MITKECAECDKSFEVNDSKRNWQSVKFCSPECQYEVTKRHVRESYTPQTWPQGGTCAWCGKTFLKLVPGHKKKQYCDRRCIAAKNKHKRALERAKRPPKVCPVCKSDFVPNKLSPTKQIYCSPKCYVKEQYQRHPKLRANRKDQGIFKRAKETVLERDGNKCTLCSSTDRLHVHHMDNSGGTEHPNNDPANLITYCNNCHQQFHRISLLRVNGEWFVQGVILDRVFDGDSIKVLR